MSTHPPSYMGIEPCSTEVMQVGNTSLWASVVSVAGDGLLMHANWLFQRAAPIILPVNLGKKARTGENWGN